MGDFLFHPVSYISKVYKIRAIVKRFYSLYTLVTRMSRETQLLHIRLDGDIIASLDDYRFSHRLETRTDAIKFLLRYGLGQNPVPPEEAKVPGGGEVKATTGEPKKATKKKQS